MVPAHRGFKPSNDFRIREGENDHTNCGKAVLIAMIVRSLLRASLTRMCNGQLRNGQFISFHLSTGNPNKAWRNENVAGNMKDMLAREASLLKSFVSTHRSTIRGHKERLKELLRFRASLNQVQTTRPGIPLDSVVVGDYFYFSDHTLTKILRKRTLSSTFNDTIDKYADSCMFSVSEIGRQHAQQQQHQRQRQHQRNRRLPRSHRSEDPIMTIKRTAISNCHNFLFMEMAEYAEPAPKLQQEQKQDQKQRPLAYVFKNMMTQSLSRLRFAFDSDCDTDMSLAAFELGTVTVKGKRQDGDPRTNSVDKVMPVLYILVADAVGRPSLVFSVHLDGLDTSQINDILLKVNDTQLNQNLKQYRNMNRALQPHLQRQHQLQRRQRPASVKLLFHEQHPAYFTSMRLSRDRSEIFITSESKTGSELYSIATCITSTTYEPAGNDHDHDNAALRKLIPREEGLVYNVDSCGDAMVVVRRDGRGRGQGNKDRPAGDLTMNKGNSEVLVVSKSTVGQTSLWATINNTCPIPLPTSKDNITAADNNDNSPVSHLLAHLSSDFILQDIELFASFVCLLGRRSYHPVIYVVQDIIITTSQQLPSVREVDLRAAIAKASASSLWPATLKASVVSALVAGAVEISIGSGGGYRDTTLHCTMSSNAFIQGTHVPHHISTCFSYFSVQFICFLGFSCCRSVSAVGSQDGHGQGHQCQRRHQPTQPTQI